MTRAEIEQVLLSVLERKFDIKNPDRFAPLSDQGLDSIDALELLIELEEKHGVKLTQTEKKDLFEHRTIDAIADYIDRATKSHSSG